MDEDGNFRSLLLEVLQDLSRNMKDVHKSSSINKSIAISEAYAVTYGLMSPNDPNPLSLVCDTAVEGLDDLSNWDLRIDQYCRLRIGENFNMSLVEFLNLPRRLITKLISSAELMETAELRKREEAERKLKQEIDNYQAPTGMPGFNHTVPKMK